MNISFGARLRDGRRVGIEWRRRRNLRGTTVHAVLTHDGELTSEDLERCLREISDGERLLASTSETKPRRRAANCT